MTRAINNIEDPTLRREFDNVRRDLHRIYGNQIDEAVIDDVLADEITTQFSTAKIKTFLPTLVERETAQRLEAQIKEGGAEVHRRQEIVFVCEYDAGRSQLASSITRHLAGEQVAIRTVGLKATGEGSNTGGEDTEFVQHTDTIYPEVLAALEEKDYPTDLIQTQLVPRTVHRADVVVLLGVDELPGVPTKRMENWMIADPKGADVETVRGIRDQLEEQIRELLDEMDVTVIA